MTYSVLQQAAETRRSIYALNNTLPLSNEEVTKIIEHAVLHTPSSFNSQSARVVVLFGEEHAKVWHFVEEALRAVVPAEQFEATAQKLNLFKAGAATVLFFEDQDVVKGLQEQFPSYEANFPIWRIRQMPWFNMLFGQHWRLPVSAPICSTTIRCLMRPLPKNGICRKAGCCVRKW